MGLGEQILALNDDDFVAFICDLVSNSEPATNAMCVVALEILPSYISTFRFLAKQRPELKLPTSFEDMVSLLSADAPDELNERRRFWLLLALLVTRATEIAQQSTRFDGQIARLWITLAESSKYLPALLERTIVWSDLEKEGFLRAKTHGAAIQKILSSIMPKHLVANADIHAYAAAHQLKRIGDRYIQL